VLRSAAVSRIQRGLGFRTDLSTEIISALQEAQRDLEAGKTLPKFLLNESSVIDLTEGDVQWNLPADFIRMEADAGIFFFTEASTTPNFLEGKTYAEAIIANRNSAYDVLGVAPSVFVIRTDEINFINPVDADYDLYWSYYAHADVLSTDIENAWLEDKNNPEWLIGTAGLIIALDARDKDGIGIFTAMQQKGRAAQFGELLADEEQTGNFTMGAEN
jgi:hypothetical protein